MIIVFDDDKDIGEALVAALEFHGFKNVEHISNVIDLYKKKHEASLIIMDMTGNETALARVRASGTPLITISATKKLNPDINKPFELDELIKLVEARLCSARA